MVICLVSWWSVSHWRRQRSGSMSSPPEPPPLLTRRADEFAQGREDPRGMQAMSPRFSEDQQFA